LTLAALEAYGALADFGLPEGEFDADGSFRHTYRLWLVSSGWPIARPADPHYRGFVEIQRKPRREGKGIQLAVRQSVFQQTPGLADTVAQIECGEDALTTVQSWRLVHKVSDSHGKAVPEARTVQSGTVGPKAIATSQGNYGMETPRSPSRPVTSNWSLFDAVQRLPRRESPPLEFDMLEDLDLLKPSQRLTYRGEQEHVLDGKPVRLHRWQHVGRAILPHDYYLDGQGRLLVALGGLRAYILDPGVCELHKQCLATMAGRTS